MLKLDVKPLHCPKCKAEELREDGMLNLRGFKVHAQGRWWSQCLVCAGYYNDTYDELKGWF